MAFGTIRPPDGGGNEERQELAEINMIPMIDVMLVLLVIFMVAAPLSISGIKVQLPSSYAKGSQVEEAKIILTIDQKGQFYVEKMHIQDSQLSSKIAALFAEREDKSLYIRADKRVQYGSVVEAMSSAKLAGVHKIAMLTTPMNRYANKKK